MENKAQEFALSSMFKRSPNGKGMIYGPNVKGTMASMEYTQARNQEFFRAGEVSENKGTSINI